jgi:hypothetical protein
MLFENPFCGRQNFVLSLLSFAKRFFVRDRVLVAHLGEFSGSLAFAGPTVVNIYAEGLEAQLPVLGGLKGLGSPEGTGLPPTALPRSVLRSIRQVEAAYRRLGSVRAVARERHVRRSTVRLKLRLGRVLRRLGPFRTLDC